MITVNGLVLRADFSCEELADLLEFLKAAASTNMDLRKWGPWALGLYACSPWPALHVTLVLKQLVSLILGEFVGPCHVECQV